MYCNTFDNFINFSKLEGLWWVKWYLALMINQQIN
jgi:hypothetical protein